MGEIHPKKVFNLKLNCVAIVEGRSSRQHQTNWRAPVVAVTVVVALVVVAAAARLSPLAFTVGFVVVGAKIF